MLIRKTKQHVVASILTSISFAICVCDAPPVNAADGDLLWSFDPGGSDNTSHGTPAIGLDGSIYYGEDFGTEFTQRYLFAVDQNGTSRFTFAITNLGILEGYSCPSIGDDGTVYFATETDTQGGPKEGELFALNPNGTLKWRSSTNTSLPDRGFYNPAAIGTDGTAYISYPDTVVAAISSGGVLRWSYYLQGFESLAAPSIGVDGTVYVASYGGTNTLRALNPNGTLKWIFDPSGDASEGSTVPPAIGDDGTLYVAGTHSNLFAVRPNPSGPPTLKWKLSLVSFGGLGPPVVSPDGVVYVKGISTNKLFAIKDNQTNGTLVWPQPVKVGNSGQGSAAIAMDGTIYSVSDESDTGVADIRLIAINPDGTKKWISVPLEGPRPEFGSPAIAANGTVLIAPESGKLYAFAGSSPPAQTGWPMFMHDARRTGRATVPNNIYASYQHSLAIRVRDGQLFSCGLNDSGQLGLGPEYVGNTVMMPTAVTNFASVPVTNFANVREAAGGGEVNRHSVAVTRDGLLYAWGNNSAGQVGTGETSGPIPSPVAIGPTNARWVTVAAGVSCTFALSTNGTVYSWGNGLSGRLGMGTNDYNPRYAPTLISNLTRIVDIKINHMTAYALDSDGYVWSWGHNFRGALGRGIGQEIMNDSPVPTKIASLTNIVAIEAGHTHGMALQITQPGAANNFQVRRKVFLWGDNGAGQLGNGQADTVQNNPTPWENTNFAGATSIAAGSRHTFAIFEQLQPVSTVKGCGSNMSGDLGTSAPSPVVVPLQLTNWTGVARISTSFKHTLGAFRNTNIVSAGLNGNGQLGDPLTGGRSTPGPFGPLPP